MSGAISRKASNGDQALGEAAASSSRQRKSACVHDDAETLAATDGVAVGSVCEEDLLEVIKRLEGDRAELDAGPSGDGQKLPATSVPESTDLAVDKEEGLLVQLVSAVSTGIPADFPDIYGLTTLVSPGMHNVPSPNIEVEKNVTSPQQGKWRATWLPGKAVRLDIPSAIAVPAGLHLVKAPAGFSTSVKHNGQLWTCDYFVDVSTAAAAMAKAAEQEHIDDDERAWDLVSGAILRHMDALAGESGGAAQVFWDDDFDMAKGKALAALLARLPAKLAAYSDTAGWLTMLRLTVGQGTSFRDGPGGTHHISTVYPKPVEADRKAHRLKCVGKPRLSVRLVPSSSVINL